MFTEWDIAVFFRAGVFEHFQFSSRIPSILTTASFIYQTSRLEIYFPGKPWPSLSSIRSNILLPLPSFSKPVCSNPPILRYINPEIIITQPQKPLFFFSGGGWWMERHERAWLNPRNHSVENKPLTSLSPSPSYIFPLFPLPHLSFPLTSTNTPTLTKFTCTSLEEKSGSHQKPKGGEIVIYVSE